MIVDCFMFNNEFDVLDIRLNELCNTVDKFIISESNLSHSGKTKPLYLKQAMADGMFSEFKDKIQLIEVDLSLYRNGWDKENAHRNSLMAECQNLDGNDTILISDCDEIPSTDTINKLDYCFSSYPCIVFKQAFFYYTFNYVKKEECHGTIALLKESLDSTTFQMLRDSRFHLPYISASGWHLSYFGGPEIIKEKIENFAHMEYSDQNNIDIIKDRMEKGIDIFGRESNGEQLVSNAKYQLPYTVIKNKNKYKKYL